ncbi:hypothetical protein OLMES_5563 [Oleiphilus messinensis]|uniref:SGNH hydrolase-type esterase domain-containing protein n=1 Tax=Oleiphilus messinensis TaxID=141451 RepID=A0A1Y0IJD0_9GAMM|nr:hypothetical protein [Oleiphilus messinensis]ARU59543.1 hypothetical protein OLMES_5563 [Oleiphilus messinensis]
MPKRMLILTDSLGAPRIEPELVNYDQTWVAKVKCEAQNNGYDVIAFTANGLDSANLLSEVNFKLHLYKPNVVIFQFGIVDCAPRVWSDREKLLFRILNLHNLAARIGKNYHAPISKFRNITAVSIADFALNIKSINEKIRQHAPDGCTLIHVPIGPPCSAYFELSPAIGENIIRYNKVLGENSDRFLTDFSQLDPETIYTSDCHHLNQTGHEKLSKIVLDAMASVW